VGINRRVVTISSALSLAIATALLSFFSTMTPTQPAAEAAEMEQAPPAGGDDDRAARIVDTRIRAIADNLTTPAGHINQRAVRALQAQGPAAIPVLLERFTGDDTRRQEALLHVLKNISEPAVTEALIQALERGPTPSMAAKIGLALNTQGEEHFCDRLRELTQARDPAVRASAACALRTCGDRASAVVLLRLLKSDDDPSVRREAIASLGQSPLPFLEQGLHQALNDSGDRVRAEAVRIVGARRLSAFAEPLSHLAGNDPAPRVKAQARRMLALLSRDEAPPSENPADEENIEEEPEALEEQFGEEPVAAEDPSSVPGPNHR
jgi:HEAT repeat protein